MVNRSIKPEGYIGLGKAAKILDITVHRLEYLCKTGRVKFLVLIFPINSKAFSKSACGIVISIYLFIHHFSLYY